MASVSIKQITSLSALALLLDKVVDQHEEFDCRFPTNMSKIEMASEIISVFGRDSYCWGELYGDGELKFFSIVEVLDEETCYWHVLFNHPRNKSHTKKILEEIKDFLRELGLDEIFSVTRRITPSYKRFMTKFGAYQFEITYRCKL